MSVTALLFGECGCCGETGHPMKLIRCTQGWEGFAHLDTLSPVTNEIARWLTKNLEYSVDGGATYNAAIVVNRQSGECSVVDSGAMPYVGDTTDFIDGPPQSETGFAPVSWDSVVFDDDSWEAMWTQPGNPSHTVHALVTLGTPNDLGDYQIDLDHLLDDIVQFDDLAWGDLCQVEWDYTQQVRYIPYGPWNSSNFVQLLSNSATVVSSEVTFIENEVSYLTYNVFANASHADAYFVDQSFIGSMGTGGASQEKSQILWPTGSGDWCERKTVTHNLDFIDAVNLDDVVSALSKIDPDDLVTNGASETVIETVPDPVVFDDDTNWHNNFRHNVPDAVANVDNTECLCTDTTTVSDELPVSDSNMSYTLDVPASAVRVTVEVTPCVVGQLVVYHKYSSSPTTVTFDNSNPCSLVFDLVPGAGEILLENPGTTWYFGVDNVSGGYIYYDFTLTWQFVCPVVLVP